MTFNITIKHMQFSYVKVLLMKFFKKPSKWEKKENNYIKKKKNNLVDFCLHTRM